MSRHGSQIPLTYRVNVPCFSTLHSPCGSRCTRGPSASLGSAEANGGLRKPEQLWAEVPHPICGLSLFAVVILSCVIIAILIVLEMD